MKLTIFLAFLLSITHPMVAMQTFKIPAEQVLCERLNKADFDILSSIQTLLNV